MNAIGTVADVLRTGEGTAAFTQAAGMVENPAEIPELPHKLCRQPIVQDVVYTAFGETLRLGRGAYELPPLKIVDVIAYGTTPTAPARVILEADGDDQMRF